MRRPPRQEGASFLGPAPIFLGQYARYYSKLLAAQLAKRRSRHRRRRLFLVSHVRCYAAAFIDWLRKTAARPRGLCYAAQYICWPPLIDSVEPVTKVAVSETRNSTPRAISSAWPRRPIGMRATIFFSTSSG